VEEARALALFNPTWHQLLNRPFGIHGASNMTATSTNHLPTRPRRSLNDTIGRLDDLIEGLSEAIPGTIRDTLQETVGAAVAEGVRTALSELLTNPDVLSLLRGAVASVPLTVPTAEVAPTPGPTLLARMRSCFEEVPDFWPSAACNHTLFWLQQINLAAHHVSRAEVNDS
jgi:hypothetical protein